MNDVLFCKWHRLTQKKKIRNSPVNRGRACDISSSALRIQYSVNDTFPHVAIAARLFQLVEHRAAEREVTGSNPM